MNRLVISILVLYSSTAWPASYYKCVDEKGKKTFSQQPCGKSATKHEIDVPAASNTNATLADRDRTRADGEQNYSPDPFKLRRLDRSIKSQEREIKSLSAQMDSELKVLRHKKSYAYNNLAGAQWEQSIATEMQAVTDKFTTQIRTHQDELDHLRRQRDKLLNP